jgi:hypothetical protein
MRPPGYLISQRYSFGADSVPANARPSMLAIGSWVITNSFATQAVQTQQ